MDSATTSAANNFVSLSALLGAQCAHCGKRSVTLCQCPCKKAYYCDVGCQRGHWQIHKDICTKAQRHVAARLNRCASCGSLSNVLKICGCGTVYYCSLDCQRKHYGVHRRICTVAQSRANANSLNSGTMLSAFGENAAGAEGTATVSTQTEETCTQMLTVQQERLKAESAARAKLLAEQLNERRRSTIAGGGQSRPGTSFNNNQSNNNKNNNNNNNNKSPVNSSSVQTTSPQSSSFINSKNAAGSSNGNSAPNVLSGAGGVGIGNNNNNNTNVTFVDDNLQSPVVESVDSGTNTYQNPQNENEQDQNQKPDAIPVYENQNNVNGNDDEDFNDEQEPNESSPSPKTGKLGSFHQGSAAARTDSSINANNTNVQN